MDGATVQGYINLGYAKAASKIGSLYTQYRPKATGTPISPENYVGTIPAYFDPQTNFPANNPRQYGKAVLKALIDPTQIQPGDYLVGANRIYFVASIQDLMPVLVVYTNDSVTVVRSETPQSVGALPYSGERPSTLVTLISGMPASVLLKGRKEKNPTGLGSDVPQTEMEILLPFATGITPQLLPADLLTLVDGTRYVLENVELTDLGYRLRAAMVIV